MISDGFHYNKLPTNSLLFNGLNQQIMAANSILIISHQRPDGDSCGSSLALFHYLKTSGKNVAIFMADQPPSYFSFLPGLEVITGDRMILNRQWDLVIVLDSSDWAHTQVKPSNLLRKMTINIDHHFSNNRFGDINCVDDLASSTCEIIYKFFTEIKLALNYQLATCLLCGILSDTGGFYNSATTIEAIKISARLIDQGAKMYKINNQVGRNRTINGLRLWGEVLARLKIDADLKIAYTYVREEEYKKYLINDEELDGLINFLNALTDVSISALFRINRNQTVVSLRTTKDNINVAQIAQLYGGGGHQKAAGFTLPYTLDEDSDLLSFLKKDNNRCML